MNEEQLLALKKLREPFAANHISKLPKPTKAQTEAVKQNFKTGIRCKECGQWHHPDVVHLDYVGHAALTDRLLDVDPSWSWEPFTVDSNGLPAIDKDGGMWIKLTVCGITRLGYGDAQGKTGGDAMKERIGDALRNAAMRFGAALELWHKGILHLDLDDAETSPPAKPEQSAKPQASQQQKPREENAFDDLENSDFNGSALAMIEQLKAAQTIPDLTKIMNSLQDKKPFVETFNKRMAELKGNK